MNLTLTACSILSTLITLAVEIGSYEYDKVLELSLLFYEAQRSGKLPKDNRVLWRGDSALSDSGLKGEDLTGGYYDAGDFVKFGFTMASTTTILAWGLLTYKDAYVAAGQYENCLSAIKWASDYFIKCHVSDYEFYGQVGDFNLDHMFWGRPEDLNMTRPAYKIDASHPGSDLAGETSAALSAVSLLFKQEDEKYSKLCLNHSKQLYMFATTYRGLYHEAIKGAAQYYESTEYGDELTWAAVWLYKATNDSYYLDEAEAHYTKFRLKERPNEFFYNKKVAGVQAADIDLSSSPEYRKFAKEQIGYMLGDSGRSYVVGYGDRYPQQPHHAASSCPDRPQMCGWEAFNKPAANPQLLLGALVSGPDENDYYKDSRDEYIFNEVTLDYNAGFQSAVAGLKHLSLLEQKLNRTSKV